MRRFSLSLLLSATLLPSAFGADLIAWSGTNNGLRLGIGVTDLSPDAKDASLRVVIENSGTQPQTVLVGYETGGGTATSFRFLASTKEGKQRECSDLSNFTAVAGLVLPSSVRLEPGNTREFRFALKNILCIGKPGDVTFASLSVEGFSVRVSLEADEKSAEWARFSDRSISRLWTGKIISAVIDVRSQAAR